VLVHGLVTFDVAQGQWMPDALYDIIKNSAVVYVLMWHSGRHV